MRNRMTETSLINSVQYCTVHTFLPTQLGSQKIPYLQMKYMYFICTGKH